MNRSEAIRLRRRAWDAYVQSRAGECGNISPDGISYQTLGERCMKWSVRRVGEAPEGGYPLFISLHGACAEPVEPVETTD